MGWFFGCFGGAGRKARKHGPAPLSSQKAPQRPLQPLPVKVSPPFSNAIQAFADREDATNNEDYLQAKQSSRGTPAGRENGFLCQESPKKTPEKQKQGNPWSQLDDLEEELEDLRNQIEKETLDAKKIKEEVTFLRSCGTLLQTPAELRKKDRPLEIQRSNTPSKGWHSWLVPSSSPTSKPQFTELSKFRLPTEDPQADSCPAIAPCREPPHRAQTPIVENKRKEGNVHPASPLILRHDAVANVLGQENQESGCNLSCLQNTMAALQGMDKSGDVLQSVSGVQSARSPSTMGAIGLSSATTPTNDYFMVKGDVTIPSPNEKSQISKQCTENAILTREHYASNQKRFPLLTSTDPAKESEEMLTRLGGVEQIHTSNAVQVPFSSKPVSLSSKICDLDAKTTPKFVVHRYHTDESSNCASHMIPQSPSLSEVMDDSSERLKSASFMSSSYDDHCVTSDATSNSKEDKYSGGSCMNSSCFDRHDDSGLNTSDSASSSSLDSEKTLTDLCTLHSFSPSQTQTPHESVTSCRGGKSPAGFYVEEETASATPHSHGSTRNSVAQAGRRATRAARYDCEYYESEDENMFPDAISHASAECGHTHTSSNYKQISSLSIHTVGRQEDQNLIRTPNKMSQWQDTPEPKRPPKVRSRPASPVFTPVENAFQWKQLKKIENNLETGLESYEKAHKSRYDAVKASTARQMAKCTVEEAREEGWDENEPGVWMNSGGGMHSCQKQVDNCRLVSKEFARSTNTSLSHWLNPSPELRGGGSLENVDVEAVSSLQAHKHSHACGELVGNSNSAAEALPVCVDMSLSNWLHASTKQDDARCSVMSPAGLSRHCFTSASADERPILGIISGENYLSSAVKTPQWDGKGIPNTTTKYKEDQRVNWHASPFETRLERALTKQGDISHKKLFEVASTTPVSNRLKSLH
eukprot:c17995_g1_i1 orf=80-2857(+)